MTGLDLRPPLESVARAWAPRILTQLCRDPTSPLYGCADRNWWHYKIRDFPSIILQQAGYAMHLAARLPGWQEDAAPLDALAAAAARFWNDRAQRHHAFEEYYPWEQGYPPLAFSTLAMAKLAAAGIVPLDAIRPGLRAAAGQLRSRFEDKAGNQQVAGLAALAWIDKLLPDEADGPAFRRQRERTLELQHEEGWYWEYDGPDLGYLAVTIDCLWDLHDATGDPTYRDSISRALAFTAQCLAAAPQGLGLHNSRNTDYLAPYGIVRAALDGSRDAALIAAAAFATAAEPGHVFAAVDDRYICHYLGQSLFRALGLLDGQTLVSAPPARPQPLLTPGSGHYFMAEDATPGLIVSCRKGGILTLTAGGANASDFGWIVQRGSTQLVTHWWSDAWTFREEGGTIIVEGALFAHRERVATPLKHIVLRCLSFVLGRRLIGLLKRILIFKRGDTDAPRLIRRITPTIAGTAVTDTLHGLKPADTLLRAPRASKRHVASADSFHAEDLALVRGWQVTEARMETSDGLEIVTTYSQSLLEFGPEASRG